MKEKLAIYGGKPVRKKPFPERKPFGKEEIKEVTEALKSQNLFRFGGNKVENLEKEFARKYKVKYAVASTSGTAAIHIAIGAINPDPGDEIITSPITDFGTIIGILYQNAIPVFADINPETYNINPADIQRKITKRTKAIIAVHLFGNPCDMDEIMKIAKRNKLVVIEDCCQAYFTPYKGKMVGTIGDIGCFSMQQSKHLTTGDGGITITNNKKFAERMALFADKGWNRIGSGGPRTYLFLGPNYRMNELTGAVALAQLKKVEKVVEKRRILGDYLTGKIKDIPGIRPVETTPGGKHSYWVYPLKILDYDPKKFCKALNAEGIPCGVGYIGKPIFICSEALYNKKTYGNSHCPFDCPKYGKEIEYKEGDCPITEQMLSKLITICINENFSKKDIVDIANAIRKVAEGLK